MKRIYLLIIVVVSSVMLFAQQGQFADRAPCNVKAGQVGTNSIELLWDTVAGAVSYDIYKESVF